MGCSRNPGIEPEKPSIPDQGSTHVPSRREDKGAARPVLWWMAIGSTYGQVLQVHGEVNTAQDRWGPSSKPTDLAKAEQEQHGALGLIMVDIPEQASH